MSRCGAALIGKDAKADVKHAAWVANHAAGTC